MSESGAPQPPGGPPGPQYVRCTLGVRTYITSYHLTIPAPLHRTHTARRSLAGPPRRRTPLSVKGVLERKGGLINSPPLSRSMALTRRFLARGLTRFLALFRSAETAWQLPPHGLAPAAPLFLSRPPSQKSQWRIPSRLRSLACGGLVQRGCIRVSCCLPTCPSHGWAEGSSLPQSDETLVRRYGSANGDSCAHLPFAYLTRSPMERDHHRTCVACGVGAEAQ